MSSNSTRTSTRATTPIPVSESSSSATFDKFEMLLSLDTALELIHADRESLKRAETFAGYPGQYGHRVHDTMEEIFVLMLQALGERHIKPGFERCGGVYSYAVTSSHTPQSCRTDARIPPCRTRGD